MTDTHDPGDTGHALTVCAELEFALCPLASVTSYPRIDRNCRGPEARENTAARMASGGVAWRSGRRPIPRHSGYQMVAVPIGRPHAISGLPERYPGDEKRLDGHQVPVYVCAEEPVCARPSVVGKPQDCAPALHVRMGNSPSRGYCRSW